MSQQLEGKVALVTGGSRGLGAATAQALADAGADVAYTYVFSTEEAAVVEKEVQGKGVEERAFCYDQADSTLAPKLIEKVTGRFGGLDILVNNAAIGAEPRVIDDPNVDVAALDRMHATNHSGIIAIIRVAARIMRDDGRIINVGSGIGSRVGRPGFADFRSA